jgi:nitrous oxidase accessory protein NosD
MPRSFRVICAAAAVDNARPGDTVQVCADTCTEQVIVTKPLTLRSDGAIVDPSDDGFAVAFRLAADDVELRGFAIQGASVGVDASDRFAGYRITDNAIQDNTLFGIDFGSAGGRESRIDYNDLRNNAFGVVSELDDDSLWRLASGGPNASRGTLATSPTRASTTTPPPAITPSTTPSPSTSPVPGGAGT